MIDLEIYHLQLGLRGLRKIERFIIYRSILYENSSILLLLKRSNININNYKIIIIFFFSLEYD